MNLHIQHLQNYPEKSPAARSQFGQLLCSDLGKYIPVALWSTAARCSAHVVVWSYSPAHLIPVCLQSTRPAPWCVHSPRRYHQGRRAGCCTAHTQWTAVWGWSPDTWQSCPNTFWHWCLDRLTENDVLDWPVWLLKPFLSRSCGIL